MVVEGVVGGFGAAGEWFGRCWCSGGSLLGVAVVEALDEEEERAEELEAATHGNPIRAVSVSGLVLPAAENHGCFHCWLVVGVAHIELRVERVRVESNS